VPLDRVITEDPQTGRKQYLEGYEGLRALAIDDHPLFTQHPKLMQAMTGSSVQTGRFKGKMIHINATHDANGWPNFCAGYKKLVEAAMGNKISDNYRLWWVENACHGAPAVYGTMITPLKDPGIWTSRLVDYDGVTAQALRDLTKWVEEGTPPPADTAYHMSGDGDIKLEQDLQKRGGVQPVAHATVNGSTRAEVKVGDTVRFVAKAVQPSGTGVIVAAEWDFLGTGAFVPQQIRNNKSEITVEAQHVYDKPGTYFTSFRVGSSRIANGPKPYVRNNARVRVIVTA
jgi:plastocyanin